MRFAMRRDETILVNDPLDALQFAVPVAPDGNAAAAARDDDRAGPEQEHDVFLLDDVDRAGGGDDPPPAASDVLAHLPAALPFEIRDFVRPEERSYEFRGIRERGVVRIDLDHHEHAAHGRLRAAAFELVPEDPLDHVAEAPLEVGPHHVERQHGRLVLRDLDPDHLVADLRAVPVREQHFVAGLLEIRDAVERALEVAVVLFDRTRFARQRDRVPAERDDDPVFVTYFHEKPSVPRLRGRGE